MPKHPTILVAIDSWPGTYNDMIRGVIRYATQNTTWRYLPIWHRTFKDAPIQNFPEVDGLVTSRPDAPLIRHLASQGVPAVGKGLAPPGPRTAVVLRDYVADGQMAFDHVANLGFRRFASIATGHNMLQLEERHQGFVTAAKQAGFACIQHEIDPAFHQQENDLLTLTRNWEPWIRRLEYPIAVFSPRLAIARTLAFACNQLGVLVPEQMAIIAGGGDELMQCLSIPPITTIDQNYDRCGWEAAHLLDLLLQGRPLPPAPLIPPLGVIKRQSTDTLAVEHPVVAQAMRIIRDEACDPLSVGALVQRLPLGRRALEQAFKRTIGRTLAEEILRVRMEKARMLLTETDMSVTEIAGRCGYDHTSRFSHSFRRSTGMTALAYRRRHQPA